MPRVALAALAAVLLTACATVPNKGPTTIAAKTASMTRHDGFVPFYWDGATGKVWLEITRWDEPFLLMGSMPRGVGSNDLGLDRGQIGSRSVVRWIRSGNKVLLVEDNLAFRANSDNPDERRAVEEAFAKSALWGFEAFIDGARALVDATPFLLRDAHGVATRLASQGKYAVDASRSFVEADRCKGFERNTELEALVTFKSSGEATGVHVRSVVPTPSAITVGLRHSFIALPEPGYVPRIADPRAGLFEVSFMDYATAIDEPIRKHFIQRHRLEKVDPTAKISPAKKPIVYYLDRGAPEPIRGALLDGARWWNAAFEAAGFSDAFTVQMLPEGADPMDVRYNVIQWVHRSTRGWSYGDSVIDPRTGEIIKGHISLGSLRVRQDFMIAEGLLAPYDRVGASTKPMTDLALARLRQLSAHEVGHTLGLAHNFAASAKDRASVMDYPHPQIIRTKQGIDLSQAYGVGVGEWDKLAVRYAYTEFPPGADVQEKLRDIVGEGIFNGLPYITDRDARPAGGAHASAHLWDNGADVVEELRNVLLVRRYAMERFGKNNIPEGRPLGDLQATFATLYFLHRYQAEAVVKILGGAEYRYAAHGDGQTPYVPLDDRSQARALASLLASISPAVLAVPQTAIDVLTPAAPGGEANQREWFRGRTGVTFDPLGAASAAANHTVGLMLHPQRAARLVERGNLHPTLELLLDTSFKNDSRNQIQREVDHVVLIHLLSLARDGRTSPQARAIAVRQVVLLGEWLASQKPEDPREQAHFQYAHRLVEQFKRNPSELQLAPLPTMPAGSPIGCGWTEPAPRTAITGASE